VSNRRILRSTSRRRFDLANSLHVIQVEDGDNAVTAISSTRRARDQPDDFVTALLRANYFELQYRRQMMNFEWTDRIKKRRPFTAYSIHRITGNSPDVGVVQIAHDLGRAFGADVSDDHFLDSPLLSSKDSVNAHRCSSEALTAGPPPDKRALFYRWRRSSISNRRFDAGVDVVAFG
jgi:hypothetical protein